MRSTTATYSLQASYSCSSRYVTGLRADGALYMFSAWPSHLLSLHAHYDLHYDVRVPLIYSPCTDTLPHGERHSVMPNFHHGCTCFCSLLIHYASQTELLFINPTGNGRTWRTESSARGCKRVLQCIRM